MLWVAPNSGAAQAGIEQNDILLTLGDTPLGKARGSLRSTQKSRRKGGAADSPSIGRPDHAPGSTPDPGDAQTGCHKAIRREYWIGVCCDRDRAGAAGAASASENHGVIVNQVYPDSPAAKSGIALHEIIVEVDGNPITDPSDLARTVQAKGTKPLALKLAVKRWKIARMSR